MSPRWAQVNLMLLSCVLYVCACDLIELVIFTLFLIAWKLRQPKCMSVDSRI